MDHRCLRQYLEDFHMWSSVCCHPFCSCFTHMQRLTICLVLLLSYTCLNTVLAHLKQEESYIAELVRINKVNIGEQCKATRESQIHSIEGMDNAQNWHDSTAKNVIFIIALVVAWRNRDSLCPSESMVLTTGLPCFICTEAKDRIKKINSPNNIRHL
ncbi:unnamed protein product, partial [Lepidochelys olivacea]